MKKIFLLTMMLLASLSMFSRTTPETIYLKSGSVINGEIIEYVPNQSIKIITSDYSVFVCKLEDVDKVVRNITANLENQQSTAFVTPQKGYRFFIAADQMTGNLTGFKFTTTHGAQLNNKIFLGGGLGFCVAEDEKSWDTYLSIPFYADFRYDILDKKITPFIGARAGVAFAIEGITGFYGNLSFGGRFKRFSISMGVETLKGSDLYYKFDNDDYYGTYVEIPEPYRAFSFVTRFAFEF
ncbi:MAG: hypothetical protein E7077_07450 [Bacteroidales bacterium]|nr:hypothetical protein [Bacteroidales bacterium]